MSELPKWLHWLDSCPSTNTWAIAHSSSLNHGDVVFTPKQTAGRGQHGRTWYSPLGVLTASFVLDRIPTVYLPQFSLAAGLAAIYAIEELVPNCQDLLRLKWPNDVLVDGRKLAGILCESSSNGAISRVIVGIGLNLCVDFEQNGLEVKTIGHAVSLHQLSSILPDELALLTCLRSYLLQTAGLLHLDNAGLSNLLPAIRSRDALFGHFITISSTEESGQAAGINEQGYLLLRLPNGELRPFVSGHITWQYNQI